MRRCIFSLSVLLLTAEMMVFPVLAAESVVGHEVPKNQVREAGDYWTRERMRNAKPFSLIALPGRAPTSEAAAVEEPTGLPGFSRGRLADQDSVLLSDDDLAVLPYSGALEESVEALPAAGGYDYPPPHTTFYVLTSLYTTYPYKSIGKVFFSLNGSNYVCSGSAIGNKAVLTAGHCVSEGGQNKWANNWVFVPAYKNGDKPYGTWPAFYLYAFQAWLDSKEWGRDVAFACVSNQAGKTLAQTVGNLGFSWNESRKKHWNVFGYPSAAPWDGEWMVETQASLATIETAPSPDCSGVGTSQRPGFSGGPWILKFVPGGAGANNYANGVNSHFFTTSPNQIYSPYFDTAVNDLKKQAVKKN
jgi:hypothetical protein